jgi:hypothetical protein
MPVNLIDRLNQLGHLTPDEIVQRVNVTEYAPGYFSNPEIALRGRHPDQEIIVFYERTRGGERRYIFDACDEGGGEWNCRFTPNRDEAFVFENYEDAMACAECELCYSDMGFIVL